MKIYAWKLKDIILVANMALVFGAIGLFTVHFHIFFSTLLAPTGLAPLSVSVLYGIWIMPAMLAPYIMQKPGTATITEILAAVVQAMLGSVYGPRVIVTGLLQGLGAEGVFAAFRYKQFNLKTMCMGAAVSAIVSFPWTYWSLGYGNLALWLRIVLLAVRIASGVLFAGVLGKLIGDSLAKTGLLKSYPLGKTDE